MNISLLKLESRKLKGPFSKYFIIYSSCECQFRKVELFICCLTSPIVINKTLILTVFGVVIWVTDFSAYGDLQYEFLLLLSCNNSLSSKPFFSPLPQHSVMIEALPSFSSKRTNGGKGKYLISKSNVGNCTPYAKASCSESPSFQGAITY